MFENMTPRERMLAMIVGSLAPILVLFFGFLWFMDRYESNISEIDDLTAQIEAQEEKTKLGMAASDRRGYYRKISLPSRVERASNLYKNWLADLIQKECGMAYSRVILKEGGSINYERDRVATRSAFTVRPKGTLPQLIKFLHGFYSADHLHRINKLSIKPVALSKRGKEATLTGELKLEIEIETLSLVDGPRNLESFPQWIYELPSVEDAGETILARNIFGPANNKPSLEKPKTAALLFTIAKSEEDVEGNYETIQIQATDADTDDVLSFELVENSGDEKISGMVLGDQPRSASVRKISLRVPKQSKPVRIPVSMKVVDDGLPAKSDDLKFTIVFEEPAKPKPTKPKVEPKPINMAANTFVRGLNRGADGLWKAYLHIPMKSESHNLGAGDTLELNGKTWKVVDVNKEFVTFEVDGKRKSFHSDSSLTEPIESL